MEPRLLRPLDGPLAVAAALSRHAGQRLLAGALRFLLLAARQLAKLLHQRVNLLIGLLLLRALRGLVLIGELVEILLEQIREVFGDRSGPAAPSTAAASLGAHLLLVFLFGLLQLLQRAIFRWQRGIGRLGLQLLFGRLHLFGRLRHELGDFQKCRIRLHQPAVHPPDEPFHLLAQLLLRERDHHEVLAQLRRRHRFLVADDVVRSGDDLALLLRERVHVHLSSAAATASAAAALRGGRLELLVELADADEIQIARHALAAAHGVVVDRTRVIGNRVARRQLQLLEIERVRGRDLRERLAANQRLGLFRPAVHRVHQVELLHAEVVVCARFDRELLDGRRDAVASGFGDRHGRRLIFEHVDRVLRRGGHQLVFGPALQLDLVEAVFVHLQLAEERAGIRSQRNRVVVHNDAAGRRLHGGHNAHPHLGALKHRDVAAVLNLARRKTRVGRKHVLHFNLFHVR